MPVQTPGEEEALLAVLLNEAGARLAAGELDAAIQVLFQAARIAPGSAAIHHDLGYLCFQAERLQDSVAAFRESVSADRSFAQAHLGLGIVLQQQGELVQSLEAYREAARLAPQLAMAQVCLGALLEHLGDRAAAVAAFRAGAMATHDPDWSRMSHARALLAEDRDLEAEPVLRALLEREPGNAMAQEMLAQVLSNSGRFEAAGARFQQANDAAPQLAGSYYELVRCRRVGAGDRDLVSRMQAALQHGRLGTDGRLKIHLALGKAFDDLGEPETAMPHFDRADALRRTLNRFDLQSFQARIERLMSYPVDDPMTDNVSRAADRTVICVMGLPRSGTTLIEQILSNHPDAFGAGEQPFWTATGAAWEASRRCGAGAFDLRAASANYLRMMRTLAAGSARIVDKMPLNLLWAGLIHRALPGASLICCHRSPLDTALSIHRTYFNPSVEFPTGGADLVAAIGAVERLRSHWRRVLPPERFLEVRYEDLVQDPKPVVARMLSHCGLNWSEECIHPERNPRIVKTPSKWQARQPIHRESVDMQRRYRPWLGELAALLT